MAITLDEQEVPGVCAGSRIITRTWTATDDCGNSNTASQVITLEDTTAPDFANVPQDVTVECDEALPTGAPTATDACDTDVDVVMNEQQQPGSCPQELVITRVWTATDDCGNASTASQTIFVIDTEAPTLANVPQDLSLIHI